MMPDASDEEAEQPAAAPAAAHGKKERVPKRFQDVSVEVPGLGHMRYNIWMRQIYAQCSVHGSQCRRTRTAVGTEAAKFQPSSMVAGQGRPVGLLMLWLKAANRFDTAEEHGQFLDQLRTAAKQEERAAARREFMHLADAPDIAFHERPCREGESEEPRALR